MLVCLGSFDGNDDIVVIWERHPELAAFGAFSSLFLVPMGLFNLVRDLRTPSCRARTSPLRAVRYYFDAIRQGRFDLAWHCRSDVARDRPVRVSLIKAGRTPAPRR